MLTWVHLRIFEWLQEGMIRSHIVYLLASFHQQTGRCCSQLLECPHVSLDFIQIWAGKHNITSSSEEWSVRDDRAGPAYARVPLQTIS